MPHVELPIINLVLHIYLYLFVLQILQISDETKAEKDIVASVLKLKLFLQKFTCQAIVAHQILFPRKNLVSGRRVCILYFY